MHLNLRKEIFYYESAVFRISSLFHLPEGKEEQYDLLAEDGMLVKRPLIVAKDFVLVGFKEPEWADKLG